MRPNNNNKSSYAPTDFLLLLLGYGFDQPINKLNAGHELTGQWQYEWRQRQFVPTSSDPVSVNIYPYQHLHRIYPYTNMLQILLMKK